jgi:hypothetical protein
MIIFLFILQLVSFYLIAMLYAKLGRVNELKKQQDVMMREMEDAVGAYLVEMKDENDRLLKELSTVKPSESLSTRIPENKPVADSTTPLPSSKIVPKSKAVSTYKQVAAKLEVAEKEQSKEERALELSKSGYSIEEIAKRLSMGKTEVELLLKFRG